MAGRSSCCVHLLLNPDLYLSHSASTLCLSCPPPLSFFSSLQHCSPDLDLYLLLAQGFGSLTHIPFWIPVFIVPVPDTAIHFKIQSTFQDQIYHSFSESISSATLENPTLTSRSLPFTLDQTNSISRSRERKLFANTYRTYIHLRNCPVPNNSRCSSSTSRSS